MNEIMHNTCKQKGSALLVALIFLGVLTMIGVSVTLTSTSQLKIAANGENLSDTFHATNAGMSLLMEQTAAGGSVNFADDALLKSESQSGAEHSASDDFLKAVHEKAGAGYYGNKDGSNGKAITVTIKQRVKGGSCPRSAAGSSVTKIACDHFDLSSKYSVSGAYEPAIKAGVYREMVYSNSASQQEQDVSSSAADS